MKSFFLAPLLLATATTADYSDVNDIVWVTSTVQVVKTVTADQCCVYSGTTFFGSMPSAAAAWNDTMPANANATLLSIPPSKATTTAPSVPAANTTSAADDGGDDSSDGGCKIAPLLGNCDDDCCATGQVCRGLPGFCFFDSEDEGGNCVNGPGIPGADCSVYDDCCGDGISCNRDTNKCECDDDDATCGNGSPGKPPPPH